MESPDHRRLTAAEGRKFAFTLGLGFAALAALFLWRGRATASLTLSAVAILSGVLGLAVPTRLGPVSRGWAAFGAALSRITSPVFFTLFYIVVVAPIGLVRRTFGRSPLARDPRASSYWVRRPDNEGSDGRAGLERQF
jgi:hypothetical protein